MQLPLSPLAMLYVAPKQWCIYWKCHLRADRFLCSLSSCAAVPSVTKTRAGNIYLREKLMTLKLPWMCELTLEFMWHILSTFREMPWHHRVCLIDQCVNTALLTVSFGGMSQGRSVIFSVSIDTCFDAPVLGVYRMYGCKKLARFILHWNEGHLIYFLCVQCCSQHPTPIPWLV